MKNYCLYLKNILKSYSKEDIIFSNHAIIRIKQRQIDIKEIKHNLIYPDKLKFALKQYSYKKSEEKFDCYFDYSKNLCHRYIIVIKKNILIVTAIKINKKWQNIILKKIGK